MLFDIFCSWYGGSASYPPLRNIYPAEGTFCGVHDGRGDIRCALRWSEYSLAATIAYGAERLVCTSDYKNLEGWRAADRKARGTKLTGAATCCLGAGYETCPGSAERRRTDDSDPFIR